MPFRISESQALTTLLDRGWRIAVLLLLLYVVLRLIALSYGIKGKLIWPKDLPAVEPEYRGAETPVLLCGLTPSVRQRSGPSDNVIQLPWRAFQTVAIADDFDGKSAQVIIRCREMDAVIFEGQFRIFVNEADGGIKWGQAGVSDHVIRAAIDKLKAHHNEQMREQNVLKRMRRDLVRVTPFEVSISGKGTGNVRSLLMHHPDREARIIARITALTGIFGLAQQLLLG